MMNAGIERTKCPIILRELRQKNYWEYEERNPGSIRERDVEEEKNKAKKKARTDET